MTLTKKSRPSWLISAPKDRLNKYLEDRPVNMASSLTKMMTQLVMASWVSQFERHLKI